MKGTFSDVISAGAFEGNVMSDEFDDVGGISNAFLDGILVVSGGHADVVYRNFNGGQDLVQSPLRKQPPRKNQTQAALDVLGYETGHTQKRLWY